MSPRKLNLKNNIWNSHRTGLYQSTFQQVMVKGSINSIDTTNSLQWSHCFQRSTFPGISMTIYKSQRQAHWIVGIDFQSSYLSHRQHSIACHRVSKNRELFICTLRNRKRNMVFKKKTAATVIKKLLQLHVKNCLYEPSFNSGLRVS